MIKCFACNAENPEGTLICQTCGKPIDKTVPFADHVLADQDTGELNHTAHFGRLPEKGAAIYIEQSHLPLIVTVKERLTLGRRKDIHLPDLVDLGPYDAYKLGVSRNHAVLAYKDNHLYIQDTGSVNGTWLNGQRLKPFELYALPSGGAVSLGHLLIYIYY